MSDAARKIRSGKDERYFLVEVGPGSDSASTNTPVSVNGVKIDLRHNSLAIVSESHYAAVRDAKQVIRKAIVNPDGVPEKKNVKLPYIALTWLAEVGREDFDLFMSTGEVPENIMDR